MSSRSRVVDGKDSQPPFARSAFGLSCSGNSAIVSGNGRDGKRPDTDRERAVNVGLLIVFRNFPQQRTYQAAGEADVHWARARRRALAGG